MRMAVHVDTQAYLYNLLHSENINGIQKNGLILFVMALPL